VHDITTQKGLDQTKRNTKKNKQTNLKKQVSADDDNDAGEVDPSHGTVQHHHRLNSNNQEDPQQQQQPSSPSFPDDASSAAAGIQHKGDGLQEQRKTQSRNCLFSFHPHGIFPGTALFGSLTNAWAAAVELRGNQHHQRLEGGKIEKGEGKKAENDYPIQKKHQEENDYIRGKMRIESDSGGDTTATATTTTIHAASIIFNVPLLRDFIMAVGGRVVTKKAIETSLRQGNSVLIVTGGQSEMMLSKRSAKEMHLVTHHQGFLRIAATEGTPVVPLLCFAEQNVMENISLPWMQRLTLRLLGFPFPTVPYGRWFLPLPNKTPLTLVVGQPVFPSSSSAPPPSASPPTPLIKNSSRSKGKKEQEEEEEDAARIEMFRQRYFSEVKRLFYRYRAEAGYPEMELILHEKHHRSKPTS
jgi:hypothetical protein